MGVGGVGLFEKTSFIAVSTMFLYSFVQLRIAGSGIYGHTRRYNRVVSALPGLTPKRSSPKDMT